MEGSGETFYPGGWSGGSCLDLYSGDVQFESRPDTVYSDHACCCFPLSLQSDAGIPPSGHGRFLPIHYSPVTLHLMLYGLDTEGSASLPLTELKNTF